jgi:HlyD family secretion protein
MKGWILAVALGALLGGCGDKPAAGWSGYVEGDYVQVAPTIGGSLQRVDVQRGDRVERGDALFTLDAEAETAARDEAAARLAAAQAQAGNTAKGRRADEIAVTQAQLAQARANAALASAELARQQQLVAQGFLSQSRLDDARTAVEQTTQRVAELEAALRVARLPARSDERAAALAAADAASQALRASVWRPDQKRTAAPAAGLVADVFHQAGEWVGAGQPVVSLLPPEGVRARFFVPEAEIATIAPGHAVTIACDGCGAPIAARIDFIATRAEYTPPVIYSNAQRARLVFLVEARPEAKDAPRLRPGQPIDVRRAGAK